MVDKSKRVCPVERAEGLDTIIRRLLQNPRRIMKKYVRERMTVIDLGCGPGYFSIEMARMVGESGRVIAADLQEGMLHILKNKIQGKDIEKRITLHKCKENKIGISDKADFLLAFYMVHEVPDQKRLFKEIHSILKHNGKTLIVEPSLFHVSKDDFRITITNAQQAGLQPVEKPTILLSRTVVLQKI